MFLKDYTNSSMLKILEKHDLLAKPGLENYAVLVFKGNFS